MSCGCDEERATGCRKYFLMMLLAAADVWPNMRRKRRHERTKALYVKWHGRPGCESCEALDEEKETRS